MADSQIHVALAGNPNCGKTTLFNLITGANGYVGNWPGVTVEKKEAKLLSDKNVTITDLPGIYSLSPYSPEEQCSRDYLMSGEPDVVVQVVDATNLERNLYLTTQLTELGIPVVLAVNKCDTIGEPPLELYEFYNLGIGEPFPISSQHGHGTGDMLDEILKYLPETDAEDYDEDCIKVAVIGKPNAGKSSLINKIAGEERVIVSDIAGTTRDATDTVVENEQGKFVFIDTAGIRKKSRITERVEHFSVLRAYMAVDRADVCIIMIDAQTGFTEQDSKVAGYAHEQGKASIIAVNKWDLIEKDTNTMKEFQEKLEKDFSFMSYVPFVFISAKTGQRVNKLFEMIHFVANQNAIRISTGTLNDVLAYATTRVQPPSDKGRRLKIYYMTQTGVKPPCFVVFCNSRELFHFSYQRYLENQIRAVFGLEGTPVIMSIREKGDKEE